MGKESDLYDPYNTKTIGGDLRLDVDTYENVQDQIHIESVNRRLLELTDLIGRVTNNRSSSGPIPNTQTVEKVTLTTSGNKNVFVPNNGEVWQLSAAGSSAGYTGLTFLILKIQDTNSGDSVEIASQTSYNTEFTLNEPIYIGYPCKLLIRAGGTGTGGSTDITAAVIRVR